MGSRFYDDDDGGYGRGRGRPQRRERDSGFGEQPYPAAPTMATALKGTVKWFNTEKGFGFVSLEDGGKDAFLHASAVQRAGLDGVAEGATLEVEVTSDARGRSVSRVISVDESTAARRPPPARPARGGAPTGPTRTIRGTVKWFNGTKGFGFFAPEDGGKDIFLHVSALTRSGLSDVQEGDRFEATVEDTAKGPSVVSLA